MDMKGKTVLITGCNRGIGKAMFETFSAQGCNIIACLRQKNEEFDMLCEEIIQRNGTMITKYYFDMMDEDSIKSTITQIFKSKQRIDIMINNAGVVTKGLLQMTTMKQLHEVFQVNFFAHVQFIQGVSKIMMRQREGVIINMASVGGIDAYPAYISYGCSKAAMIYLTKTLSQELAPYGIRVNALAPSMTDTRMKEQMGAEANEEIMRRTALKRIAQPEEIAKLALFLASDDSSFITGQGVRIDGGLN